MLKLVDDVFFHELEKYPDCIIDYTILTNEDTYQGEVSHREALSFFLEKEEYSYDLSKAKSNRISASTLFLVPDVPWKKKIKDTVLYFDDVIGNKLSYWYAFLEPPHGTGKVFDEQGKMIHRNYTIDDFKKINRFLFPKGIEHLEIYEWSSDWSNYFDDGNEWYGSGCWSIYDAILNRYVLIMVSITD